MVITQNEFGYVGEYEGHIVMATSMSECISLIADGIELPLDLL